MDYLISNNEIIKKVSGIRNEFEQLEYCSKYFANDRDFSSLLKIYQKKPFVYILTHIYDNKKCVIYIGKSSATSARMILHKKKYEYDEVYLFEVKQYEQAMAEQRMIELFLPLYNKACNKEHYAELSKIGIDYDEYKTKKKIREDLKMLLNSQAMDTVTFFLPQKYIYAMRDEANKQGVDANTFLSKILEEVLPEESVSESIRNLQIEEGIPSEMISTKEYAETHKKSVEQIKVYCRNGRLPAVKTQRDWLIPRSAPYPKDRRHK